MLPCRRNPQNLQLIVSHASKLVCTQILCLLGQSIENVNSRNTQWHLTQQVPLRMVLATTAARPSINSAQQPSGLITHIVVAIKGRVEKHLGGGLPRESTGGKNVPQIECTIEHVLRQECCEWLLNVGMNVGIRIVDICTSTQLPEIVHCNLLPLHFSLWVEAVCLCGRDHFHSQAPKVCGSILVATLDYSIVSELLDHLQ
mmetsp:Transcript_134731/g.234141  ORF Transcript_134731/g.234141 Transcript_134731/m.234141 type:complete len:201 (-) Transcript_134731:850-1452(-)